MVFYVWVRDHVKNMMHSSRRTAETVGGERRPHIIYVSICLFISSFNFPHRFISKYSSSLINDRPK